MQTTDNLNLKKPDYTDVIDIQDLNDNADILDGVYAETTERLENLPIKSLEGQTVNADSSTSVTAGTAATIIGDLSRRTFTISGSADTGNVASGIYSTAMGHATTASGKHSTAMDYITTASGYASTAMGNRTTASGDYSTAMGNSTTASGSASTAMGQATTASGTFSTAMGYNTTASGYASTAMGCCTTAMAYQMAIGTYNTEGTARPYLSTTQGDAFIIGNGTSSATSNAFRVTYGGAVYGAGAYTSSGADIAELYEWQDGNPDNEDRRGLFVTLDGTKIRLATPEDTYIKGVISAAPCLVGDSSSENWQGKYLTDIFGEKLTEIVHYDAEYEEREIIDEETGEKTTERVKIHDEYDAVQWVINPEYDPEKEYIPREERPEYDYVSSWGKIVLVDDGSCEENGFATVGEGGKATKSDTQTMYRVMERKDDTHIYVAVGQEMGDAELNSLKGEAKKEAPS